MPTKKELYLKIKQNIPKEKRKEMNIHAKTSKKELLRLIEQDRLEGTGIFDFITKPIQRFIAPKEDFNNTSRKTLEQYGNIPIHSMYVMRAPITSAINTALNIVSLGQWNRVRKEANYDRLFHLSLICNIQKDGVVIPVILEKNEAVNITTDWKKYPGYETFPIPLRGYSQSDYSRKVRGQSVKSITLNQLVNNAIQKVGKKTFFLYDAFKNNCQYFIMYLLENSNLLTNEAKQFIFQPMEEIVKKLPGYVPSLARFITDLGASWNKLSGQGTEEEMGECNCGGQIVQRSTGSRSNKKEEQYRQLLIDTILQMRFRNGEISRNDMTKAQNDATNPLYIEARDKADSIRQSSGDTYETIYRDAESRYYETEEGKMVKAQQEAEAEASALRIAEEGRRQQWAKFSKDNPVLAGIVEFGKITAPITTEALKYVLSAVPGLPPQVKDGLNKALDLTLNIATRDDIKEGKLDIMSEIGKVAKGKGIGSGMDKKQDMIELMKQLKAYSLGDNDVQEILPTMTRIVVYNDLYDVDDIHDLMDDRGRFILLYPREAKNIGHWVCVFINRDNDIEYFDSYGEPPEHTKKDLPKEKQEELDIVEDILIEKLKKSGRGVVYNKTPYQELKYGINTCGRHCVSRLAFHQATAEEYKKILDDMKKGTKKTYDDIVSILTEI
jgi:hypothetical protein